jgi:beta-lactamase regulating signal transducer with metallopeptidase domain
MNSIGIALVWCILQVTTVSLMTGLLYVIVRRLRPAASASTLLSGIGIIAILSFLAFSPQPRWKHFPTHLPDSILGNSSTLKARAPATPIGANGQEMDSPEIRSSGTAPHGSLQLLQQTINEEIFTLRAAGIKNGWRWPATVAVLLFAATAMGWGWMLLGLSAVRRQRSRGQAVMETEISATLDGLRAELKCLTPIELRQSDDLVTAATIGWKQPAILLPVAWRQWTPGQLRAVLAHEVAHVRNRDFQSLLWGQAALVLHFYHPLVHWLISRLRLEQELVADAAAASVSGGQQQYLTVIAELALRQQDTSVLWPAQAFLPSKTTLLRRVAMLRDSKITIGRLSPVMRFVVVGVMLSFGLMAAGLREPAKQPISGTKKATKSSIASSAISSESQKQPQTMQSAIEAKSDCRNAQGELSSGKITKPNDCTPAVAVNPNHRETKYLDTKQGVLFSPHQEALTQVDSFNPYPKQTAGRTTIAENIGWGNIRVGMKREDLIKELGPPDDDSTYNWLRWRRFHIDCLFRENSPGALEVRLNQGFEEAIENGLRVGAPVEQVFEYYGAKPDFITNRNNGASKYEYSSKGILFWTYQGLVTQIVFFRPYHPKQL